MPTVPGANMSSGTGSVNIASVRLLPGSSNGELVGEQDAHHPQLAALRSHCNQRRGALQGPVNSPY